MVRVGSLELERQTGERVAELDVAAERNLLERLKRARADGSEKASVGIGFDPRAITVAL